ncbi:baseplate [Aurantimonas sp. C2-6-R+9]|uniref:baseplate n=1 Tax=unclassified Aurantimonas TaxID=2638230 RepID=UPI002E182771|nr:MULTISPECIES: baseplate [unclassified Aurantimonas]MEC5291961.1 baseplate [Aurantimonas sp. C2-3-R2]MEC5382073.1 baseplate [Aurantimonas sp. C2-6-R+9]MEC5413047.1 baseplate [Aurantimonas sp. C2-4-R8]
MLATSRPFVSRSAIPYAHWSMKVGRRAPAWGEIVDQIDDLDQGIANLIFTPKGSVPTEPEKGCDLLPWIDRPPAVAVPRLTVEIWEGLARWHPRITVREVSVAILGFAHYSVPVFWSPIASVIEDIRRTEITLTRDALLAVAGSAIVPAGSLSA